MPLCLIEIILPEEYRKEVQESLQEQTPCIKQRREN